MAGHLHPRVEEHLHRLGPQVGEGAHQFDHDPLLPTGAGTRLKLAALGRGHELVELS